MCGGDEHSHFVTQMHMIYCFLKWGELRERRGGGKERSYPSEKHSGQEEGDQWCEQYSPRDDGDVGRVRQPIKCRHLNNICLGGGLLKYLSIN